MALTKLTSNLIEGGTGTDWVTAIQTSNFTAEAGKGYFVNTTSQVLYVNLPVGVVGMEITIQDYAGTFATNKVILNANGSEKIQGSAIEGKITTNNATAVLIYQDAIEGWTSQDVRLNQTEISWATPTGQGLTYSTPSPQSSGGAAAATFPTTTFTATLAGYVISGTATIAGLPTGITAAQTITGSGAGNTLTVTLTGTFPSTDSLNTALTLSGLTISLPVEYLVVAGGGGGGKGSGGGGGGAGGYLTNYGGISLYLTAATNYTVTVGAGGAGSAAASSSPSPGANSVFSTITSKGGGYGASENTGSKNGGSGGSGGGGNFNNGSGGAGNTPSTTPSQGNSGGTGGSGNPNYSGGGGGGAGAVGSNAPGGGVGGNGGIGITNAITVASGTGPYYAGGGGGGSQNSGSAATPGTGGAGGGGTGLSYLGGGATAVNNGDDNTGGGGGGGNTTGPSPSGGSGVVILRYPNSFTISGLSGTTITVGTDKVTTFTAGTGDIQFN
jgi:hypothetical protein